MSNINEIQNAIEINNNAIAEAKKAIKELTKARKIFVDLETQYGEGAFNFSSTYETIDKSIADQMAIIDRHTEWNKKRKKQLKLIEQFNELENE